MSPALSPNDDEGVPPEPPDISVRKTVSPGCPAIIGNQLKFSITVANEGSETARGVILEDHWSWQLKPLKTNEIFDCSSPKLRWTRCKIGDMVAGSEQNLVMDFSVGGHSGESVCNLVRVSSNPAETRGTENNQVELCFDLFDPLDPDCALSELASTDVSETGIPTSDPDVLPDESVQKIALDRDDNRYVVGFSHMEHNYAGDPNGQFIHHNKNYDIRLLKYAKPVEPGKPARLIWEKTYDTGNHDFAYAVNISPDQQRIYVGGSALVESPGHAWHDAVLLEIDAASGCPVGEHFRGNNEGTTSAYYDIASDGSFVYAAGERQVNDEKLKGPHDIGGLLGVFRQDSEQTPGECDEHIIIFDSDDDELVWAWTDIRTGAFPTAAYSVELPGAGCANNCLPLVGGAAGKDGWVDSVDMAAESQLPFKSIGALRVQDIDVPVIDNRGWQQHRKRHEIAGI